MPKSAFIGDTPNVKYVSASVVKNDTAPFLVGNVVSIDSVAGTTMYGVDAPGDLDDTKYTIVRQTTAGNKNFRVNSNSNAPQNTTGGALSAANQLRVVVVVDNVPALRLRGDQAATAGNSIVAAGGGTAAADATLSIKGTTAANLLAGSVLLSLASSGANTKTLIAGDKINVAGDDTDYFVTGTGTLTLNGTTEINVGITPPLQVAQTAGLAVTVTAADGDSIQLGTAPAVGSDVEILVMDAADVVTVSGGALTAGRIYMEKCNSFFHSAGNVNVTAR